MAVFWPVPGGSDVAGSLRVGGAGSWSSAVSVVAPEGSAATSERVMGVPGARVPKSSVLADW